MYAKQTVELKTNHTLSIQSKKQLWTNKYRKKNANNHDPILKQRRLDTREVEQHAQVISKLAKDCGCISSF